MTCCFKDKKSDPCDCYKDLQYPEIGSQNYIMPFGKYKGKDLLFIGTWNPTYIIWLKDKADIRGSLKSAVINFSNTKLFKDMLYDYYAEQEAIKENQFYEKDWMWK